MAEGPLRLRTALTARGRTQHPYRRGRGEPRGVNRTPWSVVRLTRHIEGAEVCLTNRTEEMAGSVERREKQAVEQWAKDVLVARENPLARCCGGRRKAWGLRGLHRNVGGSGSRRNEEDDCGDLNNWNHDR